MAKIPGKLIVNGAKKHGPKAVEFVKENKDNIIKFAPLVGAAAAKIKIAYDNGKNNPAEKEHYRKKRYSEFKNSILATLSDQNRLQLSNYKNEIESFITQIENEEKEELVLKKPLHSKRRDDWEKILLQIEDKIKIMDYQEYLLLFNSPTTISNYFEGYDRKLNAYKKLIKEDNLKEIHKFVSKNTGKSIQSIERDFV
ncbi:hypothetical protein KQ939_09890 [Planococcus sp. CP5-4]|uniref:hypothetical protein n=1 Tax=unclassified Planococcus (in: firmicutes) TaxID=2662419 RepID=UPI001C225B11|nr:MULTISPECIES: hypothetical protein [unclassified Planococcus (in: firmicutes)]MBU9673848.1 hypothetical protein [Planococcus sp. CP5-4_YE]MBV0908976.1 hypothetical protein [Planococcus sp. CP5-4_UN]MBW6064025.1 hypothetical protein [Planococcus sp. CP5-4]